MKKGITVPHVDPKAEKDKNVPAMDLRAGIIALFVGLAFIGLAVYDHGWNPLALTKPADFPIY